MPFLCLQYTSISASNVLVSISVFCNVPGSYILHPPVGDCTIHFGLCGCQGFHSFRLQRKVHIDHRKPENSSKQKPRSNESISPKVSFIALKTTLSTILEWAVLKSILFLGIYVGAGHEVVLQFLVRYVRLLLKFKIRLRLDLSTLSNIRTKAPTLIRLNFTQKACSGCTPYLYKN